MLREGKKLAQGHTAEPQLKRSDARGGKLSLCSLTSFPNHNPGEASPAPRSRRANADSVDCKWERPSMAKATRSGGTTGRRRAWRRVTQEKGGSSKLRPAALSTPIRQRPSSGPQWFWGTLCPRSWPLAALSEGQEYVVLPGKGAAVGAGPPGKARLNLKTGLSVSCPL